MIAGAAILLGVVEQAVVWHWHEPELRRPGPLRGRRRGAARRPACAPTAPPRCRPGRPRARCAPCRASSRGSPRCASRVGSSSLAASPRCSSRHRRSCRESRTNLAATILVFAIIGLSLVVLTGWAGQVSLGQMAFVGVGAAVGGAATARLGWDLVPAVVLGGLAGRGDRAADRSSRRCAAAGSRSRSRASRSRSRRRRGCSTAASSATAPPSTGCPTSASRGPTSSASTSGARRACTTCASAGWCSRTSSSSGCAAHAPGARSSRCARTSGASRGLRGRTPAARPCSRSRARDSSLRSPGRCSCTSRAGSRSGRTAPRRASRSSRWR